MLFIFKFPLFDDFDCDSGYFGMEHPSGSLVFPPAGWRRRVVPPQSSDLRVAGSILTFPQVRWELGLCCGPVFCREGKAPLTHILLPGNLHHQETQLLLTAGFQIRIQSSQSVLYFTYLALNICLLP